MSKVTDKFQITLPKHLATSYGIKEQLHCFDLATARQRLREASRQLPTAEHHDWSRETIYSRGETR
jgi:hypothetical protein